jgi:hypothetical protein
MTAWCEHCSNTLFLAGNVELGPCVCVTVDTVAELAAPLQDDMHEGEHDTVAATLRAVLDEREDLRRERDAAWAVLEAPETDRAEGLAHYLRYGVLPELEALAEAKAALATYLSSLGHGSNPVTLPPGPLADLYELLR